MDPFAHTFFGATLAETGLRERSRYATATLIAGANLPDIDAVATFLGQDSSLYLRRGWTHGVLAMVLLPLALAGIIWAWNRWRGHKADPDGPAFDLKWIVILSYLSTWSHPTLDWMNTYGVRLLMPFDGTWFYGDTLFIIDPWFWLLTAAGVVLARSASRRAIVGWTILALLASALVLLAPMVHLGVKIGWCVGVALIVGIRLKRPSDQARRLVARTGLATLIIYIGALFGFARFSESALAEERGADPPESVQWNPQPGVPFGHERIVLDYGDHYVLVRPHQDDLTVPRGDETEVVTAALEADEIRGFANWTRFPYWEVEPLGEGHRVIFRDLRYVEPDGEPRGIGYVEVDLNAALEVIDHRSAVE